MNLEPNGSDIKQHFTQKQQPEADTGWTRLTDEIFIEVEIPDGTVSLQIYYAEAGTEAEAIPMLNGRYFSPRISDFSATQVQTIQRDIHGGFPAIILSAFSDTYGQSQRIRTA